MAVLTELKAEIDDMCKPLSQCCANATNLNIDLALLHNLKDDEWVRKI